jgi:hypothetical protein
VNKTFASVLSQEISSDDKKKSASSQTSSPVLFLTVISLSSYILTHASSTASPRALAYASLSLKTLLTFLEASDLMNVLFEPCQYTIRLSRQVGLLPVVQSDPKTDDPQRLPTLPFHKGGRAPVCAILDCCVLWLRHNLQYKLDVSSYLFEAFLQKFEPWLTGSYPDCLSTLYSGYCGNCIIPAFGSASGSFLTLSSFILY